MIQSLLVLLLFISAISYVGWIIYKNFQSKSGCTSGCAKCSIDFDKIGQQLENRKGA